MSHENQNTLVEMSIDESNLQHFVDQTRTSCAHQNKFVEVSVDLDNKIPLVSLNLKSHDGIPDYCLLGSDFALQTDFNEEVTIIISSESKQESLSNPKLFNSVTNRSNETLKTPQNVGQSTISIDVPSIIPQVVLDNNSSVDLIPLSGEFSSISQKNFEGKTVNDPFQAKVESGLSIDLLMIHSDCDDSIVCESMDVDMAFVDMSVGFIELFDELVDKDDEDFMTSHGVIGLNFQSIL